MPGGSRSPYRAPCGSDADSDEVYWLGGPWQHFVPTANGLPFYQNTTVVPNYEGSGNIAPYMQPIESSDDCGGTDQPACGPWVSPPANTYATFSPAETRNLGNCHKSGFKTVFARKFWQGRFGFTAPEICDGCVTTDSASTTKYRTLTWSATITYNSGQAFTASGTCTVDRYSGRMSGTIGQEVTYSAQYYETSDPDFEYCVDMSGGAALAGDLADAFEMNYCGGEWVGSPDHPNLANTLNDPEDNGATITTATCTETEMTIEYSSTLSGGWTTSITLTLSDGYEGSDVDADVEALLAYWNLADDVQYPWRFDSNCTAGPYLGYDETTTNTPVGILASGPACPDAGSVTDLTLEVTTGGTPGTYTFNWNPPGNDTTAPSSCSFTGTITDGLTNTGDVLGKPLTTLFGEGVVYAAFFDFNALVFGTVSCGEEGGTGLGLIGYGAYGGINGSSDAYPYAFNASQWTNAVDMSALLPGAFAAYNGTAGGGLTITANVCGGAGGAYMPGFLIKSKYAEIILLTAPSHDFDRPCGAKDEATIDQSTITTCAGADSPCNPGSLRWPDATTCPDDGWNDNHPKGDWLLVAWTYDYRGTPGVVTNAWTGITLTPYCSSFMPCCPAVIYLSNGGESSANSPPSPVAVPALTLDPCYGNRLAMAPMQWMTDPLWQVPVMSAECYNANPPHGDPWVEDDGSGHSDTDGGTTNNYYYPQRPFEEARTSVPSGAPGLPSGCYLPAMSVAEINANGSYPAEPNRVIYPPIGGQCFSPVWVWSANRLANIASSGRFSCDYADPFAVCGDNTEIEP